MTSVIFAIHDDGVHDSNPLTKTLSDRDLRLVLNSAPAGINLRDGEDATVRDTQVRAAE